MKGTLLFLVSVSAVASAIGQETLGLAARYPSDIGIQNDPSVLLFDGFERYNVPSQALKHNGGQWDGIGGTANTAIDFVTKFSGTRSWRVTFPITSTEWGSALRKQLAGERVLFARGYMRYSPGFSQRPGHRGILISGDYKYPCRGTPSNGTGWFLFLLENFVHATEPQPGYGEIYAYHPLQKSLCGDHWELVPLLDPPEGQWFVYEIMVRLNDLGQRNGEVKAWYNGVLRADFKNLFIRSRFDLLCDTVMYGEHMHKNFHTGDHVWWDNIVIARQYIGPMVR